MESKKVAREYGAHREVLDRLASWAAERLAPLSRDPAHGVHQIATRVKTLESLQAKVARPDRTYRSINEVTDLVGMRVMTYFEDAIPHIQRFIEEQFEVDYRNSVDKGEGLGTSSFGYRSVHIICQAPERFRFSGPGGGTPMPLEIQLRTVLQHAWAEIEHDLGYKTAEAVPRRIRRKFSRLASLLEIADEEFVQIRGELGEYEEAVRTHGGEGWQSLDIDKVSLDHLVRRESVQALNRRLSLLMDRPLVEEPFHPEYLVRVLQASGLSTVLQVESAFDLLVPKLPSFVDAYFRFTEEQWDFGPPRVHSVGQGYCLLFVAYFHLLRSETPGIPALERATRFLQKTDRLARPEAREAAQRLLAAFDEGAETL